MSVDLSLAHVPRTAAAALRELADHAETTGYDFDMYGKGSAISSFEERVASMLGKEAAAFFPTGTAAQQAVLYAHTSGTAPLCGQRPSLLLHGTSHLVFLDCLGDGSAQAAAFEASAAANLPDFTVVPFGEMTRVVSAGDVRAALSSTPAAAVAVLELPQRMNGGGTPSLSELREIAEACQKQGVRLHCDGARLWEVQPHYGVPLAELAALFDSVYLSFYKGVGALAGAVLVGEVPLVADARVWAKRRGADLFTRGPLALSCERALAAALAGPFDFAARIARLQELVGLVCRKAAAGEGDGDAVAPRLFFEPATPQSSMVHCYLRGEPGTLERAHASAAAASGVRLWNRIRGRGHVLAQMGDTDPTGWCYFEWSLGPANAAIADEAVAAGWSAFFVELDRAAA